MLGKAFAPQRGAMGLWWAWAIVGPVEPTEAELMAVIREAAAWGGWLVYHTYDSRRSDAGFPDLVLVRGRELLVVEVKAAKGRLRPAQREWLAALEGVRDVSALVVRGDAETSGLCRRLCSRSG